MKKDQLSSPNNRLNPSQVSQTSLSEWQNGLVALLPSSVKVNFATSEAASRSMNYNNYSQQQQQNHNPLAPSSEQNRRMPQQQQQSFPGIYDQWSSGLSHAPSGQNNSQFSLFGGKTSSFFSNGLIGGNGTANDKFNGNSRVAPPPGLTPFASDPAIIASSAAGGKNTPPRPTAHSNMDDTPHWMKSLQMLTLDGDHGNNNDLYDATHMAFSGLPAGNHTAAPSMGANSGRVPPPGFHSRHLFSGNTDFVRHHGGLLENQS